jgi:hypothetical protein
MKNFFKCLGVFFFICTTGIIPCEAKPFKHTLSIGSIFHNEADYMKEWIDYHKIVGVEHFFLYNNNSTDNYLSVLDPYIKAGLVDLIEWPSAQEGNEWINFCYTVQTNAYNDAIIRSRKISKWLALIDLDEFIIPVNYKTVSELLEDKYSDVAGLCVNWQCYGTSGIGRLNKDYPMIGQLVMKMEAHHPWNRFCKSIVQPLHVEYSISPHHCAYKKGHRAVVANLKKCTGEKSKAVEISDIRINHYWTRDESYFYNTKIARHQKWGNDVTNLLELASQMNSEFDGIMFRFLPKLCGNVPMIKPPSKK